MNNELKILEKDVISLKQSIDMIQQLIKEQEEYLDEFEEFIAQSKENIEKSSESVHIAQTYSLNIQHIKNIFTGIGLVFISILVFY
jgi:t-SNARE complex subunit (syntaxin)